LGEGGQKTKFKNNIAAIKLVRELESTGRMATPDEQKVLAKYVGWGGIPQAFDANNADWSKEYTEITSLMSDDELASARQSTRYAHYTSKEIIQDGIYAAMRQFGFAGGKTLEAGAGAGNFIGMMPADMRSAGRFTAIEREPFSSAIARQLYPQQNVQRADFTEFKGTDGYFDAAVGNPPFASDPQTDRSGRKHLSGLSLHNYFFAKNIDMLREGGIMAQVVTNAFMDANTDKARKYISDRAELLGAIRLPNSAFAKNANTEVTTDIIFFKKRPDGEVGGKAARADAKRWLDTGTFTDKKGKQVALNQYFIDNPSMMLGDFGAHGSMYGPDFPALIAKPGQDTLALLKEAVGKLPAGIYKSIADTGTDSQVNAAVVALKNPSVKEGGYFVEGDKLMQRLPDIAGEARGVEITPETQWTEKTKLGEPGFERIKSLAAMRTTVRGLLAAEMSDDAKAMTALRKTLNEQYDTYRDTHALINDPSTLRVFDDDPDFPLLASLEHGYTPGIGPAAAKRLGVKPTVSTAKKGPIFSQRVVAARQAVQKVETPADALAVSMAERGKLDAAYIGTLLGMEPEAVLKELSTGDKPLLFRDPATDEYVLRDAYLSGNVRAKLAQAKQAGMFTNINALEAVQPEDVGSHEITARLGSPWVPTSVYKEFAQTLYGEESKAYVTYLPVNSTFQVAVTGASEVALNNTWGTPDYSGSEMLQALMNNRSIKVTYKDSDGKTHTNVKATEDANTKAQEIKEKFSDWLFSDPERSELLTKAYNETNNNYVTRVYDGSNMNFPGKVPDSIIKFRRHQRNAIARIVQDRTALLDHVVGAGKTFTVISGAMELKRTGLARKPMVAVPNHLVKQWAADFYRLYPGANVLTATKKDFEKANRRKFLARIATGDWDAVVIAHSSYGFIKPSPEFEAEFHQREINKIMATIKNVESEDGEKQTKRRTVKQMEGMKERLENRIKALRDKPMDDLLDFEQIGVDQLFVDEAHMFKNLMYTTKMQGVAGLNDPTGSQRAYDMYVKTNQVMEKNGRGQGVVFATGTPVSNSLAEMYHMMRYLMPAQMKELGFESFDAWANTYASVEQVWMQAPSGDGFKAQNRMSNFVNTPELLKMFDQVSDTVTMDDIKTAYSEENNGDEFPLPKLKGGRRAPVSLEKSVGQNAYMDTIAERAKAIEKRKGPPQKGDDNILVVMSDARKAAMDIRLVNPDITEREPGGRIDRSTDEVVARYKQYDAVKGTQLVFSDLGTPLKNAQKELKEYEALQVRIDAGNEDVATSATLGNEAAMSIMEDAEAAQVELDAMGPDWLSAVKSAMRGFSIYDDFKAALIEKGVPEAEIAFIHDANTDDQKAALFRKVNAGQIRVLLGSTAKMGAGTNVQDRLVALHHLDVPWRPSDVEQREGRIERQGNLLATPPTKDKANPHHIPGFEIEILAYVTRDTLDMRMWQVQETKLKMINQLRTRKIGREIDNAFEDMELSAGEMQAAATGDVNLLKEIQLRNDVKKLEQRRRSFDGQRNDLIARKRRNAEQLRDLPKQMQAAEIEAKFAEQYKSDLYAKAPPFKMNIDGKDYADAKEAREYLRVKDEATVESTDPAGEVTTKKAPLSVTIDGEPIKNRAIMAELFANARGDIEPIMWAMNGETYRRRTVLANAMRQNVINALADENVQQVGTIGAYSVAVEGSADKSGAGLLEVTMRRDGDVKLSNQITIGESNAAPARVIAQVENLMRSAISEANYLERALQRAQKDAAELGKTEVAGDWPEQSKLDAARAAHKDLLAKLKQKDAAKAPAADDAAFSRSTPEETSALKALSENDELFSLAKSDSKTVEGIVADASEGITVKKEKDAVGRTVYTLTMPDGKTATLSMRPFNPYATEEAPTLYGYTLKDGEMTGLAIERPGTNPEDAGELDDVWVDVSSLKTGGGGAILYNIAQTYAHNTGRIFIGDPAGLTDDALRRRTEQMLSSALKFGTTRHLAPHPRQVEGDDALGIPPLKWTYGDDLSNIRSLIETSLANYTDVNPLTFEPSTGRYLDSEGNELDRSAISLIAQDGPGREKGAGRTTLQRVAILESLVREESGPGGTARPGAGVLERLLATALQYGASTRDIFYSRSADSVASAQSTQAVEKIVQGITSRWANAPEVVVVSSMQDAQIPARVRAQDLKQRSGGAKGEPEGFFLGGKAYIVASQVSSPKDVARVLFHESLGHFGLRGVFGDQLKPILMQLSGLRRAEVAAKAKQYGLDMKIESERLQAAEEVLAEMAQTRPEMGFVKRAIAIIRSWLRRNVPGFKNLALTDADIVANYILPARGWVERGQQVDMRGAVPAFNRGTNDVMANEDVVGNQGGRSADDSTPGVVKRLQDQLAKIESAYEPLRKRKAFGAEWSDVEARASAVMGQLSALTGDPYGKKTVKLQTPSDDALNAEYSSPKDVPQDVRAWVQKNSSILTSDATDAVRWGRIADTLKDDRYPSGDLTIYRAVADGDEIRAGDWVTTERRYAEMHLSKYLSGKGQILEETVNGRDVLVSPTGDNEEAIYAPRSLSGPVENEPTAPDSGGAPIAQTDTPAFKKWFGDSKVVDADGKPLVVYHGTGNTFTSFNLDQSPTNPSTFLEGAYFANKDSQAFGKTSMPVYLKIENPFVLDLNRSRFDSVSWQEAVDAAVRGDTEYLIEDLVEYGELSREDAEEVANKVQNKEHDGFIIQNVAYTNHTVEYLIPSSFASNASRPTQIKSATENNGNFDASNPDIRFSRTLTGALNNAQDLKLPAGYIVNDFFKGDGKLSWWHKTVGTQYNLAQRSPEFKRVFDGTQDFINDVSKYATEAADLAPSILPKLDSMKDLLKSPMTAADNKAIAAPIFEGTLVWMRDGAGKPIKASVMEEAAAKMGVEEKAQRLFRENKVTEGLLKMWQGLPIAQYEALIEGKYGREFLKPGIVFTPAELKSLFNLTGKKLENGKYDGQIGLYQEFREATDKSLTSLALADMIRFGGKEVEPIRDIVLASKTPNEAAETIAQYLRSVADLNPKRRNVILDTAEKMITKGDQITDLMDRGYAPLSRFGSYSLDVVDENGARVYFGLFESKAEANKMARQMRANFPNGTISQGTMSDEEYKLFAGVSPETLELFGEMLGLEANGNDASHQAFQQYLKLAKANRSAMKRLIERKGIAGFSEDPGRVLAGFVYSNARQTSAGLHMGDITQAVQDIPKGQGELKDSAMKLFEYVKNPQEEAQKIRGLLFAQYLGGSIASAMINLMQPLNVSFPWLSQYGGAVKAAGQMKNALVDAMKASTGDTALDAALKKAADDGIVSPQEVFQLMAQAQGKATLKPGDGTLTGDAMAKGSNALSKLSLAWGKVFGLAEQFNRRTTFIAAYRTAIEQKLGNPAAFAEKAVNETQFVYNKGAKPRWARGAVGGVLFTFKSYSINYVELLSRMANSGPEGKKAALLALGVLFLMSGAGGLPFAEDIDDLIDGVMQRLGYNFSSKQAKQAFLTGMLGRDGAQFVEKGISGLAGVPIDVSGRLGMGNLIPGTGLLTKKQNYGRDILELAGPAGDLAKRSLEAVGKVVDGNITGRTGALVTMSPTATRNVIQAVDMANMGMYRDATGKKVIDTDGYDAFAKAIGFQPNDVARVQDATRQVQNMIGQNKMRESEIANQWAQGLFEKDAGKVQDARDALKRWNEDNPSAPIRIAMPQIIKRVKAMREDKATRMTKTAPKEIRATVRRELADAE
jgi:N12 class adenine-specific DNA methylase